MFGISSFEFVIILLVALVVLGPDKLPKVMRTFTKVMSDFRRIKTDFQRVVNTELAFHEQQELKKEKEKQAATAAPADAENVPPTAVEDADSAAPATTPQQGQPDTAADSGSPDSESSDSSGQLADSPAPDIAPDAARIEPGQNEQDQAGPAPATAQSRASDAAPPQNDPAPGTSSGNIYGSVADDAANREKAQS